MPVDPHTLPCVVARGSVGVSLQKPTLTLALPCMAAVAGILLAPETSGFIHSEVRALPDQTQRKPHEF